MKILGIIPARYASTRFPGKPLIDLAGKSMIQRVYEQCLLSKQLDEVIIATDDERIYKHAQQINANVIMTSTDHQSGTDRCAEVIQKLDKPFDVAINIQGDEPLIDPEQIDLVCSCFEDSNTEIATLVKVIDKEDVLFNTNTPKVVLNSEKFAIYFSRECIPHLRNYPKEEWFKHHKYYQHIGIYAYKTDVLMRITQLNTSSLEKAESLEQLRWLEFGFKIKTATTRIESIAIDSPEDVNKVLLYLNK